MTRNAFIMRLRPGCAEEYERRHDRIWPELKQVLAAAGVSDYSVYLDEKSNTLFAIWKLSEDNSAGALSTLPVVRKWWDYMSDIMETNDDNSPVCESLKEVFHMD